MKTILVPTDFSPAASAAVKFAITLAKKFNSTLILLHVMESVDEGSFNIEGEAVASGSWEDKLFNMKMIEKARKQLAQAKSSIIDAGVNVKSVLRVGDAYHGIQSIITEQNTDLVVMGTEGSSGFQELLVGSNTERVVRRSACPVISVNRNSKVDTVQSIVWATSLKNEDAELPAVLRRLMETEGTKVHLVRINTPGLFLSDVASREKLNAFAKAMKLKNFTVNIYNDHDEEEGIIRFASGVNAHLIALSTHGRRGLSHLLNGSIAEDIVNHSKRPVMTYVIGKKLSKK
ncbi:MAG TPA: universal stress protein [Cyclobacteriaceae bacterium]|nr:universal stress protein [Cyclobacteriaceae bacterium]